MDWSFQFIFNSILLGIGLAMDAFSVSLANGLQDPKMKIEKQLGIAFVFAVFQALMPLIGWFCVISIADKFLAFKKFIPWIALLLLTYIGGSMIREGKQQNKIYEEKNADLGFGALIIQGIATSIDALSVGFTISNYNLMMAIACAMIIASVTFLICTAGVSIGKHFGTKFEGRSSVFGGVILVFIGLEIFITGVF